MAVGITGTEQTKHQADQCSNDKALPHKVEQNGTILLSYKEINENDPFFYGPYLDLYPGNYTLNIEFIIDKSDSFLLENKINTVITAQSGISTINQYSNSFSLNYNNNTVNQIIKFQITDIYKDVEFVAYISQLDESYLKKIILLSRMALIA